MFATRFELDSGFWGWLANLDFGRIGYGIVAAFVLTWAISVLVWKKGRIEERWGAMIDR